MKKINFFKLTIFTGILFLLSLVVYKGFAMYLYNKDILDISNYIVDNYKILLILEAYIKQILLTITFFFFGFSIANNILKLKKIKKITKTNLYIFTLIIHISTVVLLLVMLTYPSILLYEITSLLMMGLIIIWFGTVISDFIKSKNNNTSIYSRVVMTALALLLIVTNTYKVVNDYKVTESLKNAYHYKIDLLTSILGQDEDNDIVLNEMIQLHENMILTFNTSSLYAGKSAFFMYSQLETNLFYTQEDGIIFLDVEERLKVIIENTTTLENYLYTEDIYEIYTINYGLFLGGSSSFVLLILLVLAGVVTIKYFPLKREDDSNYQDIKNILEEKLNENLISKSEYNYLLRKVR